MKLKLAFPSRMCMKRRGNVGGRGFAKYILVPQSGIHLCPRSWCDLGETLSPCRSYETRLDESRSKHVGVCWPQEVYKDALRILPGCTAIMPTPIGVSKSAYHRFEVSEEIKDYSIYLAIAQCLDSHHKHSCNLIGAYGLLELAHL